MIFKTETTYPVETVKAQMEVKAKELGFGIIETYEFKKLLQNKGFSITRNVTLYELCNPLAAHEALNKMPEISVYLPCRISVYEQNGVTILATIGIEEIINSVSSIDEELKKHMQEIFNNVRALMNSW